MQTTQRRQYTGMLADLDFSIEVPPGFVQPPLPADSSPPDFDSPTVSAPLALLSSEVALALVAVAARPAYSDGSVRQWLEYLCGHFGLTVVGIGPAFIGDGGAHPGVVAEGTQVQESTRLRFALAAFEDGGRLVTAHGMCPEELWPSFGAALVSSVRSVTLARPKGPTAPIEGAGAAGSA